MTAKRTDKPWGHEDLLHVGDRIVLKLIFMAAEQKCSMQYHQNKEEIFAVLSGRLKFRVGNSIDTLEEIIMCPGNTYLIKTGTIHQMEALEDCYYYEASTTELDDVVRLKDDYGRV